MYGCVTPAPFERVAFLFEERTIFRGGEGDTFFPVMEYVDVAGVAGGISIYRCASSHIAFRIAAGGEEAKNIRLDVSYRHGTQPQSARLTAGIADCPQRGGYG